MLVEVRNNDVSQALRVLRKRMMREGLIGEIRRREYYEKPSERRVREWKRGQKRAAKRARYMAEQDGVRLSR